MPKVNKWALTGLMAAVMCICSWLTVPFTVPFTMQTFAVFCALLLLGGKYGTLSVLVYMLLGAVGLPVFSGFRGGIAHLLGPTGGYIVGFLVTGLLYWTFEPLIKKKPQLKWAALTIGLLLCYLVGTLWFSVVYTRQGTEYGFGAILATCVLPYIIPDAIKMFLAVKLSDRVRKAFPEKE